MPDDPPRIVLVVDDDSAIGENLKEILEMEGYVCWLTRSADAALRRLELELRSPDVILLDFLMPGMSVSRFISRLKVRATWARAPIVLATGASPEDIPADLQVDALLPKPFSIERLLELVSGDADQSAGPTIRASHAARVDAKAHVAEVHRAEQRADIESPAGRGSGAILDAFHPRNMCAVRAAVTLPARLYPVADDAAATVLAARRERLDGALEAVEDMVRPRRHHLERLVVLVSAHFAVPGHGSLLLAP